MSEEAAFLEVLKANPADDTARLVYADWLDDHDEPAKAEYLRLVAELGRESDDIAGHPHSKRLPALADTLPEEWRTQTGARFVVTLFKYDHPNKINLIKSLREVIGCGLGEAAAMSETLPHRLFEPVTLERAIGIINSIRQTPSVVVTILPTELESLPYSVTYVVYLLRYLVDATRADPRLEKASCEARTRFLAEVNGGNSDEFAFTPHAFHTVLARGLTIVEANARIQTLIRHLPPYDRTQGWYLWVGTQHVTTKNDL